MQSLMKIMGLVALTLGNTPTAVAEGVLAMERADDNECALVAMAVTVVLTLTGSKLANSAAWKASGAASVRRRFVGASRALVGGGGARARAVLGGGGSKLR